MKLEWTELKKSLRNEDVKELVKEWTPPDSPGIVFYYWKSGEYLSLQKVDYHQSISEELGEDHLWTGWNAARWTTNLGEVPPEMVRSIRHWILTNQVEHKECYSCQCWKTDEPPTEIPDAWLEDRQLKEVKNVQN